MSTIRRAVVRTSHGAAAVVLAAGDLEATFLPDAGMVGVSLRHGGDELVAMPHPVRGYRQGRQTGIPLLAPWANRLGAWRYAADGQVVDLDGQDLPTDPNGLPIHGTVTAHPGWEVTSLTPARLRSVLRYGDHPDLLAAFPFPHDLVVEAALSPRALRVTTMVRPTGDRPVPVSFGWHPYLRLPGTPQRSWRLALPACQHEELDDRSLPTGRSTALPAQDEPIGERTFDDLYRLGDDRVLAVEDRRRRLVVRFDEGYPYAQVYAPSDGGFVCLEPMTAPGNALVAGGYPTVAPGDEFVARFTIEPTVPGGRQ